MILYNNTALQLQQVKEKPFKLESEIQKIFENNLQLIMGLQMVRSEFTIKNKRIDTLAYDKQTNAFIIIEYKRDKNYSVVDQGLTYLNLMLQNKAEFILTRLFEVFYKNQTFLQVWIAVGSTVIASEEQRSVAIY